ncbi:MAG: RNA polymerase subunit sigma-24 [Burkholderiales bacterium PBB3]|nr:MAG: RNA polymerase subunit sigma-24 [Burkholderiales bacterium PBB3]
MYDERTLNLLESDRRHLVRAASRLLGPADAEDAVQDAYVRALEADALALNSTQAWLLTVVRNLAIDRLRRRNWMQHWLDMTADDTEQASPSAEIDAALAQEAALALQLLAAHLTPADGAAVLLHEVFEASHAEIAEASGKTEASSRQQLRRALLRLRQAGTRTDTELEPPEDTVFRLYLQSLQLRDPQTLWAMLRHPPISAALTSGRAEPFDKLRANGIGANVTCGVIQVGGQLGLVLTLDGVRLCVVPLGVRHDCDLEALQR